MKVKIIRDIPINGLSKPKIGEVYEVLSVEYMNGRGPKVKYTIKKNPTVCVFDYECEVVEK